MIQFVPEAAKAFLLEKASLQMRIGCKVYVVAKVVSLVRDGGNFIKCNKTTE